MKNILSISPKRTFSKDLPKDKITENYSRQVEKSCYSEVETKNPSNPELVHFSQEFLNDLNLGIENNTEFLKVVSGQKKFNGFDAYAMCYGGHQFGNWAGQLGDGRAINIAEIDINNENWKLQLKGAGPTPYSRSADGFAVLRSSIREYLCSEAMHHLGVPTTRALSLVKSGDMVLRDMLYDGNPKLETGAIVCRMSKSFIRFGNFELLASRNESQLLKQLVDYTIKNHYPYIGNPSKEAYIKFFKEVATKTREMIIHWQRVGFVHGVMNTDNMSILGLTIDYGPYGWLENYDENWTPNTTDRHLKRYRFGNQLNISLWNLYKLANALYPLVLEVEPFEEILESYKIDFFAELQKMKFSKLGLYGNDISGSFIEKLEQLMEANEIDMTLFYRLLCEREYANNWDSFKLLLVKSSYKSNELSYSDWQPWFNKYQELIISEGLELDFRFKKMKKINPKYVLRNYIAQLVIEKTEKGDYSLLDKVYKMLLNPYDEQPDMEDWFSLRPDWAKSKVGCSMLSCSS